MQILLFQKAKSDKIRKGIRLNSICRCEKGDKCMKKIGILMMAVFVLTGCVQQTNLTEQQSDTIANYAAYVALQHDKNYEKKLIETASEVAQGNESTANAGEQNLNQASENGGALPTDTTALNMNVQDGTTQDEAVQEVPTIASILKLDGFNVTYTGLEYDKQYQDTTVANGYTAKSLDNSEFVVMKFTIENTTDETKLCDVLSLSPKFNVSVNGEEAIRSYASLLNNDLTTLCNEIGAHETMEVVLLVEVGQEYENNVSGVSLDIIVNGVTSTIVLQ